jgi:hypothetical protein
VSMLIQGIISARGILSFSKQIVYLQKTHYSLKTKNKICFW